MEPEGSSPNSQEPSPVLLWMCPNMINVLWWGVVSTSPNPQAARPPFVGCPRMLIQYIRRYPSYLEAVPPFRNLSTRHAVWQGPIYHRDRDPHHCDRDPLCTQIHNLCICTIILLLFQSRHKQNIYQLMFQGHRLHFPEELPFSVASKWTQEARSSQLHSLHTWYYLTRFPTSDIINMCRWKFLFRHRLFYIFTNSGHLLI